MPWTLSEKSKSTRVPAEGSGESTPATTRRRGVHVRRRMTPDQLPLWRDVLTLQQQLRPEALATIRAGKRGAHPFRAASALLVTIAAIVVWSVQLQRGAGGGGAGTAGVAARLRSILGALNVDRIAQAWAPITGALAAGVAFHVALLVVPATRPFVRRHPVAPVALGAMLALLALQLAA